MKTKSGYLAINGGFLKKSSLNPDLNFYMERHGIFGNYGASSRVKNSGRHHVTCMASLTADGRCAECGKEFEP